MSESESYPGRIPCTYETRDRLKEHGIKGEHYDDILNRLMEKAEQGK